MSPFLWDEKKNARLKVGRGVSFEQAVVLLEQGKVLDIVEHPNTGKYPAQKIAILDIDGYAWLLPFVESGDTFVLKTLIPSRKATKKYLGNSDA